jgi:hypothetical protein
MGNGAGGWPRSSATDASRFAATKQATAALLLALTTVNSVFPRNIQADRRI